MYLGNTCYVALVGPVYYQGEAKPSYYTIDVEVTAIDQDSTAITKTVNSVLFSRDIPLEDLPKDIEEVPIADIVSFRKHDNLVTFKIGSRNFEYKVPGF